MDVIKTQMAYFPISLAMRKRVSNTQKGLDDCTFVYIELRLRDDTVHKINIYMGCKRIIIQIFLDYVPSLITRNCTSNGS